MYQIWACNGNFICYTIYYPTCNKFNKRLENGFVFSSIHLYRYILTTAHKKDSKVQISINISKAVELIDRKVCHTLAHIYCIKIHDETGEKSKVNVDITRRENWLNVHHLVDHSKSMEHHMQR